MNAPYAVEIARRQVCSDDESWSERFSAALSKEVVTMAMAVTCASYLPT